jgi:hypothetical protein
MIQDTGLAEGLDLAVTFDLGDLREIKLGIANFKAIPEYSMVFYCFVWFKRLNNGISFR